MKILFVCTGNSCRSAMAKAYLEKRITGLKLKGIEVSSAGISPFPGMRATRETQQVLEEYGIDVSNHVARSLTDMEIRDSDIVFVMEAAHRRHICERYPQAARKTHLLKGFNKIGDFNASNAADIADPIGKGLDFYKKTFADIKKAVDRVVEEIVLKTAVK